MKVVPDNRHTVTPWVVSQQNTAALIEFIVEVFDARRDTRLEADGLIIHAELFIGDSMVMLFDQPKWPEAPGFLRVFVADDAEVLRRAVERGATIVTQPTELFWGDRMSRFRDPFGNLWWIQQRVFEPSEEEIRRRYFDPVYIKALEYTQSADVFTDM
jgi:PhnB protein